MSPRVASGETYRFPKLGLRRAAATVASFAVLAGASVVTAAPASAHDAVISSNPGDKQVLEEFPHRVSLKFSGNPKNNFNTVAISDADAKEVLYSHVPEVVGNEVSLDIPEGINPGPGNYIIGFQITSSDGHSTRGKTTFSVGNPDAAGAAEAGAESRQTGANAEETKSLPLWAYGLGGGLIVIIAAVVTVINRKAK
ncbi:copper resistance CopC family protein [Corynebacterium vitaeruminis]|uniref:copper resistance CopC family protein n=1 Tax=Corynebacterium vitaeruminis TaxID=38305 RepID=UPI0009E59C31|nr:copper resistance protein CopC [Corynebacterium vitaeruminis]